MSLENTFNSIATNDNLPRTPSRTPSKDFNISTITSTAKKLNYMNNSFYDATQNSSVSQFAKQISNPSNSSVVASTCTNVDLMQSKIEHLEKERLELSLQLHKRNERDRNYKIKIEQLDSVIKSHEESKKKLAIEITRLTNENKILKTDKQDLQTEITKLVKEIQSIDHIETKDLWQKMANLSNELKRIERELVSNNQEKNNLLKEKEKLLLENSLLQESINMNNMELTEWRAKYESLLAEKETLKELTEEQKEKIQFYLSENSELNEKLLTLEKENSSLTTLKEDAESKYSELEKDYHVQQEELEKAKEEVQIIQLPPPPPAVDENMLLEISTKNEEISSLQQMIQELKDKLFENERKRKQLHNRLQEYKGNIRVLIRCRPFLPIDQEDPDTYGQSLLIFHEDKTSMTVIHPSAAGITNGKETSTSTNTTNNSAVISQNGRIQSYQYTFDQIFTSSSSQEDIYHEVNDLIQSVLDGYRVCIFSYGQTGSGKTHTMTGDRQGTNRGIIPRAFEDLLQQSSHLQSLGWDVSIQLSIVELYNEEFRDLLVPVTKNASFKDKEKEKEKEKIKISYQNNRTVVSGLTNHVINMTSVEGALKQFHELLDLSAQTRTTACTNMNETSSRSHLIVLIDFIGKHTVMNNGSDNIPAGNRRTSTIPQTQQQSVIIGGLKLCDLAGSERLDRTNTLNDSTRLKETVNINKSLSCLADVFNAINNKNSHIPFRNSKLTMLLQDCLSGDGKSMMFVNISPTLASIQETICSLRFANQVSQVELGKAQKNIFTTASLIPQITNTTKEEKEKSASVPQSQASSAPSASNNMPIATNKPFSSNNRRESMANPRKNEPLEEIKVESLPEPQAHFKANSKSKRNYEQTTMATSKSVRFDTSENENYDTNAVQPSPEIMERVMKPSNSGSNLNINPISTPSLTQQYSFLPQSSLTTSSSNSFLPISMNEKLQQYLSSKRNLGTSQRRSSVLGGNGLLAHPARSSLLPSNESVIGKRDSSSMMMGSSHANVMNSSVLNESTTNVMVSKKSRTDYYSANIASLNTSISQHTTSTRKGGWR